MITKKESRADYYDEGYSHGYVDGYERAELDYAEEMKKRENKIKVKIAEYKDDAIIHMERNEMIDTVLDIIDKYKTETGE